MRNEIEKARKYSLRLLSICQRTEKDVRTRLSGKDFEEKIIEEVVSSLKREGLINDLRYARDWLCAKISQSPMSREALKEGLRQKGVKESVIERAFQEKSGELEERKLAESALRQKISISGRELDLGEKGRLYGYMARKGFEPELCEELINEMTEER